MGFWNALFGARAESEEKGRKRPSPDISLSPISIVEGRIIAAFTRVKQDITLLSSWLKYLRHKDLLNEQRHTKTQRELGEHTATISGLKGEVQELKSAVKELHTELEKAREAKYAENKSVSELNPNLIRTKSVLNPNRKRTYFENKVVSMLRSRKRDYVLKQILELAAKETHSTREIEEIIVGERALCGRTAFYDYMRELKHKRMISHTERGAKKVIVAEKAGVEQVR